MLGIPDDCWPGKAKKDTFTAIYERKDSIGVYVKPEYRRQGYGTQLVEMLGGIQDRQWWTGEEGSGEFWLCLKS